MKKACVIGWPIAHSRSPLIHNYWLHTLGIEGNYTKVAVEPQNVESFLRSLANNGFAGCNVTVPHKETAFQLADLKEESAEAVGAANTLWLDNGKLIAANTDTYGFMGQLTASAPDWQCSAGPVCILGAGGAARAITYGFLQAGASDVRIFNRSQSRARELADYFGSGVSAHSWEDRHPHAREAAVLVNSTSVGMKGEGSLGIDATKLQPHCVVADIVYVPLATELLRDANAAGLRTADGLGMLLHQAVPGFERWFGKRPAVTPELYNLIAADIEAA